MSAGKTTAPNRPSKTCHGACPSSATRGRRSTGKSLPGLRENCAASMFMFMRYHRLGAPRARAWLERYAYTENGHTIALRRFGSLVDSNAYVFWAIIDPVRARSAFSTITCGKASSSAPPRTGGRRTTHHFAPAKWRRCMGTPALGNARQRPWRTAFADIDRFFLHARERSILDGLGRRQRAQEIAEIVGERMKLTTDGVSGERARYRRSGESVRKPPPDRESRRRRGKPQLRRRSHHVPSS